MPVSGVIITCAEGCSAEVSSRISSINGVEVHGILPDGQIVAVVEADTVDGEVELVAGLYEVEGIQAVRLAYHNFEDIAH
ncbi:MAG: chaperone NapD [Oryzomonas sp.]|uniref:chaperone NapD n=1 Tax=Oryzomonas sp. TaxID=2855186 RepID=UPI002843BB1D|nr:chaperone NapD [Oryzomonas sp.]MDR3581385.1 chaperone NapD [Oryzomonas sp.]